MTRSAIPDPRDESLRDRETVRLPRSTSDEIDELVDEGRYPNRSAFIRAGARLLLECEREDVWPEFGQRREETIEAEPSADSPDSLQEVAANTEPASATPAADGGTAAAEGTATGRASLVDVGLGGQADQEAAADAYEFVADSPAVSEADIVTKLSSVMREATAGERAVLAS